MTETPMVDRVDGFRDALRDAVANTLADPKANCAEAQGRTLKRIAETLDAVPDVMLHNLAVIDEATGGQVMVAAKMYLLAVGSGRTVDYADAAAFLAEFNPLFEAVRKRRIN